MQLMCHGARTLGDSAREVRAVPRLPVPVLYAVPFAIVPLFVPAVSF